MRSRPEILRWQGVEEGWNVGAALVGIGLLMTWADKRLCLTYFVIALVALIGTWSQNLAFTAEPGHDNPVAFILACFENHAAASISIDLLLFGVAAFVFMKLEAKRYQIRFYWLYVVASLVVAISVVFPVFMIARQARIAKLRVNGVDPA
ncbi:MAG: hypothetical protein JWN48_5770 [Myxococcaceae bacterium]|nr:hypothetical protein [Myxococcaceae bacterium]